MKAYSMKLINFTNLKDFKGLKNGEQCIVKANCLHQAKIIASIYNIELI